MTPFIAGASFDSELSDQVIGKASLIYILLRIPCIVTLKIARC